MSNTSSYLPHNGIATIQDFITGTYDVFGMGLDLGAFLAVYGAVIDGNVAAWSIGGPSSQLGGLGSGGLLLSQPQGISGSHNKYESDASPTRPDLYEYGNDYKVITSQFEELFNKQPNAATANYNLDVLTDFRYERFQESIANNPHFFNGPFTGVVVQPAAYTFIYRFMGNKSAEYPEVCLLFLPIHPLNEIRTNSGRQGILNQDVLKSFFSITGSPGSFVVGFPYFSSKKQILIYNSQWTEGHEKIPDNWYKRAIGDEYTIPFFNIDLQLMALKYPEFLSVGGNTGKTNSFTGVNIQDLTGGVFNAATLAQGNNAICFAFQFAQQAAPDLLKGVLSNLLGDLTAALSTLTKGFSAAESVLGGCPALTSVDDSQFAAYPGAAGSY